MGIKNGVSYHTKAEVTMTVSFPEDRVCCRYCPLCVKDPDNYGRFVCFDTREILVYPEITIGSQCKAKIRTEEK